MRVTIPAKGTGLEVGVGTGRFAAPLGIRFGLDPSPKMVEVAKKRGIDVVIGVGEDLPFKNSSFDFVVLVTTICFLDDAKKALFEAYRVLKPGGSISVGFVDAESLLGTLYEKKREFSPFYKEARFFSAQEVLELLKAAGFSMISFMQTLLPGKPTRAVKPGHGEGGFVVARGIKGAYAPS